MMKRPLASITLVYVAGLLAGDVVPVWPDILLPITFGFAALTFFTLVYRGGIKPASGLWPLVFLTGWTNYSCQTTPLAPYDLRNLNLLPAELVRVRGKLAETPSQRVSVHEEKEAYRFLASLRTTELARRNNDWQPASGNLLVLTPGMLPPEFFAGQEVEIYGVLSAPPGPVAEGLFDYAAYLRRQSVFFQLKTEGTGDWTLLSENRTPPVSDRFLAWAHEALARGLPTEDQPLKMLWSMTLGWKTVDNTVYEPFMRSGTMHIFAISGLHIALMAGIFVALLRVFQVPRSWCGLVVIPLIWFYTAATGWQPSAIRSTIMMSVIIAGWALARPTDLLNSLAASAFCILLWDPQQLFGASFQLSFFVVLSIGLLLPLFEAASDPWLKTEPLLPTKLVPAWKLRLLDCLRWLRTSLGISLAAWIGSLPITAYYFHLFSPITLLANVVVVPVSSLALASNMGSLLCTAWCAPVAELFNHTAWFCMLLVIRASEFCAAIPFVSTWVKAPSLAVTIAHYAVVIALLLGWWRHPQRRFLLGTAMLTLVSLLGWRWIDERRRCSLTVVPLSGGYSVFAQQGAAPKLLVDCGRSNAVDLTIKSLLHSRGINRLDAFALTHGDVRHIGGAGLVAELFSPRHVYVSPVRFRSTAYRQALQVLESSEPVEKVAAEARVGPWRVLHPSPQDKFTLADDNALVLFSAWQGVQIIVLSDLGDAGQAALLKRYPQLRADIIVSGLPVRGEALSQELVKQLQPRLVIVADSEFPAAERASPQLKRRLSKLGVPVVFTRSAGTVTVELNSNEWICRTMSGGRYHSR